MLFIFLTILLIVLLVIIFILMVWNHKKKKDDYVINFLLPPPDISKVIVDLLNGIIQSSQIQNMSFNIASNCPPSVLNNIQLCNEVAVADQYESHVIDKACSDICDATRETGHTTCDGIRKGCKAGCEVSTKKTHCMHTCDNNSQSCYDNVNKVDRSCKDACHSTTITGGYMFRIPFVRGAGALNVLDVNNIQLMPNSVDKFSIDINLVIPTIISQADYDIWQDPIPHMKGSLPLKTNNTLAYGTGVLTTVNTDKGTGYYLQINSLHIDIPPNVFDSNSLLKIIDALGMSIQFLTAGLVNIKKDMLDLVNDTVASQLKDALNGVLKDQVITLP